MTTKGWTMRAATMADAEAIHQLIVASERDLTGHVETTSDRVVADLTRPAIELAKDTLLVHSEDGALAGWGWVHRGRRAEVVVHPRYRGRRLGTHLLAWTEERARETGSERLGQNVSDADAGAVELLTAQGYQPKATLWLMEIMSSELPPVPALPTGISVRPFRVGDEHAAYEVVEGAFGDWQERHRDYDEWAQNTIERESFAPRLSPLAFDGDVLVGAVISLDLPDNSDGYVERVAVRRDYRNRGIARALLQHAFREFYARGKKTCFLYTHSETGALALYERAGMTVRLSGTHFSKALG